MCAELSKTELRRVFSEVRDKCADAEKDRLITERLLSHPKIAAADTVLIYASFRSEVGTQKAY